MCWDTAYSTPDNTCTVVLGQSYCGIATLVAAFDPDASVSLAESPLLLAVPAYQHPLAKGTPLNSFSAIRCVPTIVEASLIRGHRDLVALYLNVPLGDAEIRRG